MTMPMFKTLGKRLGSFLPVVSWLANVHLRDHGSASWLAVHLRDHGSAGMQRTYMLFSMGRTRPMPSMANIALPKKMGRLAAPMACWSDGKCAMPTCLGYVCEPVNDLIDHLQRPQRPCLWRR